MKKLVTPARRPQSENESKLSIVLSKKVLEALKQLCLIYGKTLEEFVAEVLDRSLGKRRTVKERFFNGRHFALPQNMFILTALPEHEWEKLRMWQDASDKLTTLTGRNGEVWILNDTRRSRRTLKKKE